MMYFIKTVFFIVIFLLLQPLYADVIIGNGNIERINDGATKDINCQNYTIRIGGLLDTSNGGVLREVTRLEINGEWKYGSGQIVELGAWVNNGTVASTPTQTGSVPNLEFTTLCGPISVQGTSDTDGDGISDADEGDNAVALGHGISLDQDGDGIYNFLDDDSDNDGILDVDEGDNSVDSDGDGVPDYLDRWNMGIHIEKTTNGVDADTAAKAVPVATDAVVRWRYVVTNTGNVVLKNIRVEDDKEGMVSCPQNYLDPGESMQCADIIGFAVTGDYVNTATVTAIDGIGYYYIEDKDSSHYHAVEAVTGEITGSVAEKLENGALVPLDGVILILHNKNGLEVARTQTDEEGNYRFEDIIPGEYYIDEIQPSGYSNLFEREGGKDGEAANPVINRINVVVSEQETDIGNDFIEISNDIVEIDPPATVSNVTDTMAELHWNAADGVMNYQIFENGVFKYQVDGDITSFLLTGLKPNTTYRYMVKLVDLDGVLESHVESVEFKTLPLGGVFGNSMNMVPVYYMLLMDQ